MIDQWRIGMLGSINPLFRLWHAETKTSLIGPIKSRAWNESDDRIIFSMGSMFGGHPEAVALVRKTFPAGEFVDDVKVVFQMTPADFAFIKLSAR